MPQASDMCLRAARRSPSPWSTTRPSPISPTASPPTDTEALLTRWISARTGGRSVAYAVAVGPVVGAVGGHAAGERHVPARRAAVAQPVEHDQALADLAHGLAADRHRGAAHALDQRAHGRAL